MRRRRCAGCSSCCHVQEGRTSWILAATILGSSLAFIDSTAVTVALPAIQHAFQGTVADAQWVIESYVLMLASLLLVGGAAGDQFGRRRIYLIGVALFTAGSVWSGLSANIREIIFGRTVHGLGAALLVPGSMAIISAAFNEQERGRAIGAWSGFSAITAAAGLMLGGWLVEHISWHWIFFINVPLALIVTGLVLRWVPESRREGRGALDWPGAVLTALGLGGIVYGLIESSNIGWRHPAIAGALAGGCICLAAFLIVEMHSTSPMLPLTLFRSRNFSGANLQTFFLYGGLNGALIFFPFNLIQVQGYSTTSAGAAFLPFILIMFFLSGWAGGLVRRNGAKAPLVTGPLIAALGFAIFTVPGIDDSYWTAFFPGAVVLGLGMAVSVAPLTMTVMSALPQDEAGIASGVNNAVSRLGALLAIAVYGIILVHVFSSQLDRKLLAIDMPPEIRQSIEKQKTKLAGIEVPSGMPSQSVLPFKRAVSESFVVGFRSIMIISAMLSLLSALCALMLIRSK